MSDSYLILALFLSFAWGCIWAACLQWTRWGRWLALYRTWITVVVGVGVDLGILALILDWNTWKIVAGVFALSSLGIIYRSLHNEFAADASEISTTK